MNNADASLEQLARSITEQGAPISAQGVDRRFTPEAAELAKAVLEEAVLRAVQISKKVPIELLNRFNGVYLIDCSKQNLPEELAEVWPGTGKKGEVGHAQLKLEAVFELSQGQLTGLNLLAGKTHDSKGPLANRLLGPGSLRIQDLGYRNLKQMAEQARHGEFWLSRYKHGTCLSLPTGDAFDLPQWLMSLEKEQETQSEQAVMLGASALLDARLIAQRMLPEACEKRRIALKKRKAKQGKQPTKAELVLCDWTLLVTNAPRDMLCIDEALILYAARWQIELLFKLWKSHAKIDESRSSKPWRRLCEVYCKLLGVLIKHWISSVGTWSNPKRSLVKAAQVVTEYAKTIALAFCGKGSLRGALRTTTEAMQIGCNQNSRRKQPNTWLTLLLYLLPWGLN